MNLKELIFGEGVHAGGSGGVYRDSVQAWLPIKNIIGGVVITKDNRFVKIVEVLPVNIYLKSAIDRQNIISSFASYLQIAPDELQMIARTLPADTQAYVEQMQRYAEQEENEACQEMIEDNIREIGHGIAGGAMRHRFFLVFQYEPSMRAKRNTVQAIIQRLNEEADTARRYLDLCELEVTLGLIKRHQRSDTLLLTNSGRAFLQAALEGDVPNLTLSYHDAAIERRVRLSSLMMTAYHAGINVFTITANSLAEPSTLFITAITRSRGHNPWGSARVGAIAHLGSTYYAVHYIYSGIGRMAVNDELAAFHNHTNFGKDTQRAFLFAGASYADIMEELKARDEKRDAKLIRYSEAYRGLHYPVHLLSCDETGARQLQIMAVPDYRVKISKLMLRSAYRPPPEDAPAWDATYQNRPFVIGADMNLRRIDAAIASAKKRGCLPISLAALDAQGDAVLLRRYKDTGYAVIYKVTESVLTELFGHPPSLYLPPCTQYLTKKGAVVDAPLIQVDRKDRGSPRK